MSLTPNAVTKLSEFPVGEGSDNTGFCPIMKVLSAAKMKNSSDQLNHK
jgi:hypothetical protein